MFTADFFTPIVDDPYWYGAIAAANSLSDVYAMGARPVAALNIAMFPNQSEFLPVLKQVMRGGIEKMSQAGVPVIGGHTIRDKEPKYGFAVLGLVHPEKILDNSKARPGDAMILTKKIGTGIIATGVKAGLCSDATIEEVSTSMAFLNKLASEIMLETGVSTATDITGFGLVGHLLEVLKASDCCARLNLKQVPFFTDAVRLAQENKVPGGTRANRRSFDPYVRWPEGVTDIEKLLLNDAQTSGGLLIFVPAPKKEQLVSALYKEGILAAHIGDVCDDLNKEAERILVI